MKEVIEVCITVAPIVVAAVGAVGSVLLGLFKRKANKKLTVEQQKNDLRAYMIKRCEVNELFAPVVKMGIKDKSTVSSYKGSIVVNDCTLYAKACGYAWYTEDYIKEELTKYIKSANVVAGKTTEI